MGLFVGNVTDSTANTLKAFSTDLTEAPIYGCAWNGDKVSHQGKRLFAAKSMNWSPSLNGKPGVDDFQDAENGNSPFHVWKGVDVYDSEKDIHTVTVNAESFEDTERGNTIFEADPEKYASLILKNQYAPTGNRVCIYKKFYWKRPSKWCWMVSSSAHKNEGFTLHPAFYRRKNYNEDKVEWKYMMVNEYCYSAASDHRSQPGSTSLANNTMDGFRNVAKGFGQKIMDYPIVSMITILATIKYADLNAQLTTGYGSTHYDTPYSQNAEDGADNIIGMDGCESSLTAQNVDTRTMGLVNWYGNNWDHVEGVFNYAGYLYVNEDATCDIWPTISNYESYGYKKLPQPSPYSNNSYINSITYDPQNPIYMYPDELGGNDSTAIGDCSWHYTGSTQYLLYVSGASCDGSACGLFTWYAGTPFSNAAWHCSARGFRPVA